MINTPQSGLISLSDTLHSLFSTPMSSGTASEKADSSYGSPAVLPISPSQQSPSQRLQIWLVTSESALPKASREKDASTPPHPPSSSPLWGCHCPSSWPPSLQGPVIYRSHLHMGPGL
ncbi:unnamed protein product [Pleuronectes platessa]|uniref:Uncharacterized protein n=1 Tax=Pleuronectes platessa TaxID=8262 RepID=A0A9N7V050_PLEPL|nr:unnamed protein product [Pleuronectes platessa]